MGNRAVITTRENWKYNGVGIYLHWNGGRDSVEPFLKYCELKGYRSPSRDCYGWARLCQVIGNFFGGSLSIGIDTIWHLDRDNGDNGVYIIEDWEIVDRYYFDGAEQDEYDFEKMLIEIDERMPEDEWLGEEFLTAKEYSSDELDIGDTVFYLGYGDNQPRKCTVVAKVDSSTEDGKKIPIIDNYGDTLEAQLNNRNNFLKDEKYRAIKRGGSK